MPPPPPPPEPRSHHRHHHHHLVKKPTSLPDVIFTAFSLLVLFSTTPFNKPTSPFLKKIPFPFSNPKKSPKIMHTTNPRNRRFATPQSLSDWLKPRLAHDLFGSWGVKPGTKNVHNLWLEIAQGETFLADSSPPVRTVEVAVVRIVRSDGRVLIESHQEMSNGVIRDRCRPLSEKMKPGESVEAAVYRAVREELGSLVKVDPLEDFDCGVSGKVKDELGSSVKNGSLEGFDLGECDSAAGGISGKVRILPGSYARKVEDRVSESYPGLPARYVLHTVDAEVEGLPDGEFSTEELDEYGALDGRELADSAVSCRKHFWKWVESDLI